MKYFLPLFVLTAFAATASAIPNGSIEVVVPIGVHNYGGIANEAGIANGAVAGNGAGIGNSDIGSNGGALADSDSPANNGVVRNRVW